MTKDNIAENNLLKYYYSWLYNLAQKHEETLI